MASQKSDTKEAAHSKHVGINIMTFLLSLLFIEWTLEKNPYILQIQALKR